MLHILGYSHGWKSDFKAIRDYLIKHVSTWPASIEHVGSTAIPGLASRPIIDIDIIVSHDHVSNTEIKLIESLGYNYKGEKGISGRHAFGQLNSLPKHHLYLCILGSEGLKNHLLFRDYLLSHPEKVTEYSALKKQLSIMHPYDRQSYIRGKTRFIVQCLREAGLCDQYIRQIEQVNYARKSSLRND